MEKREYGPNVHKGSVGENYGPDVTRDGGEEHEEGGIAGLHANHDETGVPFEVGSPNGGDGNNSGA